LNRTAIQETNISESIEKIVKPRRRRETVNEETSEAVGMGGYTALAVVAAVYLSRRRYA